MIPAFCAIIQWLLSGFHSFSLLYFAAYSSYEINVRRANVPNVVITQILLRCVRRRRASAEHPQL